MIIFDFTMKDEEKGCQLGYRTAAVTLPEVLDCFLDFLKGSGFYVNPGATLEIVDPTPQEHADDTVADRDDADEDNK